MVALRTPAQRSRPGLERHPERCGVPAVRRVRHDADAGQRRARRARAQRQGEGAEEHGVDHDAVGGELRQDGAQVAALAGERADEDPAQVVLDPAHAALGRRLALGVGHHQVVGVVLRREGHEAGARRLHLVPVVRRREEHDLVPVVDEPAGQRQQRRGVALGRRRAQDEAPGCDRTRPTERAGCRATVSLTGRTASPRHDGAAPGRERRAPSTLDPSRPWSVLTATVPVTPSKSPRRPRMLSSTVAPSPRA